MQRVMKKIMPLSLGVVAVSIAASQVIMASWNPPTSEPPDNNVEAPINVGSQAQYKTGPFGIKIAGGTTYWISENGNSLSFKTGNNSSSAVERLFLGEDGNLSATVKMTTPELCLGSPATCRTSWPTGNEALPTGTNGQTIRNNGTGWVSDSLIHNNGTNVGIDTNNPTAKLDINGQIRIEGGNPADGKLLTAADGNGNAQWEVPLYAGSYTVHWKETHASKKCRFAHPITKVCECPAGYTGYVYWDFLDAYNTTGFWDDGGMRNGSVAIVQCVYTPDKTCPSGQVVIAMNGAGDIACKSGYIAGSIP